MLLWARIFIIALLHTHSCYASTFGWAGDRLRGGRAVCIHRYLRPDDVGVASRTLACGTRVLLVNPRTKKMAVARVVDRGPYGAVLRGRWVLKRRRQDPGRWRGCLDLTRRAAELLGHNGFEPVLYAPLLGSL